FLSKRKRFCSRSKKFYSAQRKFHSRRKKSLSKSKKFYSRRKRFWSCSEKFCSGPEKSPHSSKERNRWLRERTPTVNDCHVPSLWPGGARAPPAASPIRPRGWRVALPRLYLRRPAPMVALTTP